MREESTTKRTKKSTFIEHKKLRTLRHGATSLDQERRRGVEMRDAVEYARKRAHRAWHDSCPFSLIKEREQAEAWGRVYGSVLDWEAAACVAARKDLRAIWAREDAEWGSPLAPHITRITLGELNKIESETLKASREAYLAEARTLGVNARKDELKRLVQALDLTGDVELKTSGVQNNARGKEETPNCQTRALYPVQVVDRRDAAIEELNDAELHRVASGDGDSA